MTINESKIMQNGKFYQCQNYYVHLKHPEKYLREDKKLTARSGMEIDYFRTFDRNDSILKWSSENIAIPYQKPIFNDVGKIIRFELRNYFPDIYFIMKNKNGEIKEVLGEIKPESQVYEPKEPKRITQKSKKNYINKKCAWYVNKCKWKAACDFTEYARRVKKRNIEFNLFIENNQVLDYNLIRKIYETK